MGKNKGQPQKNVRQARILSVGEIRQNIARLRERIDQVGELLLEGHPYRDAHRVKVEHSIRETIRDIFGVTSSEFQAHKDLALNIASPTEMAHAVDGLEQLIDSLEDQECDLLGKPRPARKLRRASSALIAAMVAPQAEGSASRSTPAPVSNAAETPTTPTSTTTAAPQKPPEPPPPPASVPVRSHEQPPMSPSRSGSNQWGPAPTPADPAPVVTAAGRHANLAEALEVIRKICERFHGVVRQLRERSEERAPFEIEDEFDVRDLLRTLLHMEFEEVVSEEWTATAQTGSKQVDFWVKPFGVVVVATKTRKGMGPNELAEFWAGACQRYVNRGACHGLVGFIYDPEGRIGSPRRLEADLKAAERSGKGEVYVRPS